MVRTAAWTGMLGLMVVGGELSAQGTKSSKPAAPEATISSVMDAQLSALEGPLVAAAEAMPPEKYAFAPDIGEFSGVRSFALELKHVATANFVFYSAILDKPLPPGVSLAGATNGPDDILTKEQIVNYLKESLALGHRAVSTLTERNALVPLARSPMQSMNSRLALAAWACSHAWDHYGQIVEYLRLNGIVPPASSGQRPAAQSAARVQRPTPDGSHDFDFEIGTWHTHLALLVHPLTGSKAWVEYDGTSVVRKVWGGRANLVELEADGPAGHIEGLSLRLYDPKSHQWSLHFANSATGSLAAPTIGDFKGRRGEFYDQESLDGRAILDRFVIIEISPDTYRFEQSFSADGGKSWEVNWIATDTRTSPDGAAR